MNKEPRMTCLASALRAFTGVGAAIFLFGCGTTQVPFDIAGSKADGTVVMGANVGEFDRVDWDGANASALKRCRAWGYTSTEAFSGVRERCIVPGGFGGCIKKELSRTYQCLD